eukprot:scaffold70294_cov30-Tisochrysis_lutea.AAC.2
MRATIQRFQAPILEGEARRHIHSTIGRAVLGTMARARAGGCPFERALGGSLERRYARSAA